jgi:hypothetical protein
MKEGRGYKGGNTVDYTYNGNSKKKKEDRREDVPLKGRIQWHGYVAPFARGRCRSDLTLEHDGVKKQTDCLLRPDQPTRNDDD